MKELLDYIVGKITGGKDYEIVENQEDNRSNFEIKADPSVFGLIIGKSGRTIKAIRNLLKVRAIIEKRGVNVSVSEK